MCFEAVQKFFWTAHYYNYSAEGKKNNIIQFLARLRAKNWIMEMDVRAFGGGTFVKKVWVVQRGRFGQPKRTGGEGT
jgi:hypothetical protein